MALKQMTMATNTMSANRKHKGKNCYAGDESLSKNGSACYMSANV